MPEWNGYDDVGSALTCSVFHSIFESNYSSSSAVLIGLVVRRATYADSPLQFSLSPNRKAARPSDVGCSHCGHQASFRKGMKLRQNLATGAALLGRGDRLPN
jgi:hypothetical protein